jgi:hypothetical protein
LAHGTGGVNVLRGEMDVNAPLPPLLHLLLHIAKVAKRPVEPSEDDVIATAEDAVEFSSLRPFDGSASTQKQPHRWTIGPNPPSAQTQTSPSSVPNQTRPPEL